MNLDWQALQTDGVVWGFSLWSLLIASHVSVLQVAHLPSVCLYLLIHMIIFLLIIIFIVCFLVSLTSPLCYGTFIALQALHCLFH